MKKITLLLLMSTFWGYAQIKNYTFSQSAGYFTPISGGTKLGDAYSDDQRFLDPAVPQGHPISNTGIGLPIGFNFMFNGYSYDRFAVNANGWISLGNSALSPAVNMSASSSYSPLSSTNTAVTAELSAKICALGYNLQAQSGTSPETASSLRYETIGVGSNRTLVVQWLNYKKSGGAGTGDSFSFQIRLNETLNTVDIVYGTVVSNSTPDGNFQVGLRAEPAATATNFACLTSAGGWDFAEPATAASATVLMNDQMTPYDGLTYTWTPPTCGGAKGLVATSVSTNSALLSWGGYIPVPSGYEYVVSTSAVLPVGSGTSGSGVNVSISNLSSSTLYNVFLRTKCGEFTPWTLAGTFKTKCVDALSIIENFDSYPVGETSMPNCWSVAGNGQTYIYSGGVTPGSAPNRLYMFGDGSTTIPTVAYAVLPPVSSLQSASYRLRFKAYATAADRKLDVGYFTNNDDVNTFVLLESISLASTTASSAVEYTIVPPALPAGVKNLVFKNKGTASGTTNLFIDDVIWEVNPNCPNVSNLMGKGVLSTSVNLSWSAAGSETAWQYVYGPSSVIDPSSLNPVNTSTKSLVVNGLNPSTSYKIWVRSKCHDGVYGAWIGPVTFTTTCAPVSEFAQNFDAGTTFPSCWRILGPAFGANMPTVGDAPSSPRALGMYTAWDIPSVITVMQPVSNFGVGSHRLRFKYRGAAVGARIDLGYLTDAYDAASFVLLESFYASSASNFEEIVRGFGSTPTSPYFAFRVAGTSSSTVYVDDVFWEPIPTCHDIASLSSYDIASTSASLYWMALDSQKAWQYVLGTSADTNPNELPPVDVVSNDIKVDGLTANTSYKVWVRSKCTSNKGAWIGPIVFMTSCESVSSFVENFDTSANLPSCWNKVGTTGSVYAAPSLGSGMPSAPSGSNVLFLKGNSATEPAIVAIRPVSNSAEGTHRLRFKCSSSANNAVLEVGFMTNFSDPSTFSLLKTITVTSTSDFQSATATLGLDPTTEVLAFRNPGVPSSVIFIDDVVWEPIPTCAVTITLKTTEITSNAIGFSWIKVGTATAWQYVVGTATDKNPDALNPVNVATAFAKANNLTPATTYKIWVRSKCSGTSVGDWAGPIIVTTTCAPATAIAENFDANVSFPSCWSKIGPQGSAYVSPVSESATGSNILHLYSDSDNAMAVVALPAIDNTVATNYLMKFKFKSNVVGAGLEVGYLTNISDPSTFVSFRSFTTTSSTGFENASLNLGGPLPSQVLAFRNMGIPTAAIYIDEVSVSEPTLGVDGFDVSNFSFYPNPVKDVLNISLDKEITDVTIINLLGQQIISQSNNANHIKVDMAGLTAGTYLVKITSANQSKTIKVVKE